MPAAVVQSVSGTAAGTTLMLAFGATPSAGNLIISFTGDNTLVTGGSLVTQNNSFGGNLALLFSQQAAAGNATLRCGFKQFETGSSNSYTFFNSSASSVQMTLYEISGVNAATTQNMTYASNTFTATPVTATTPTLATVAGPSGVVLAYMQVMGGSVGSIASTPFGLDETTIRSGAASKTEASLGTSYSNTFNWVTGRNGMTGIVAVSDLGRRGVLPMMGIGA